MYICSHVRPSQVPVAGHWLGSCSLWHWAYISSQVSYVGHEYQQDGVWGKGKPSGVVYCLFELTCPCRPRPERIEKLRKCKTLEELILEAQKVTGHSSLLPKVIYRSRGDSQVELPAQVTPGIQVWE